MQCCLSERVCVSCYRCVCLVLFTLLFRLFVKKNSIKKNWLILAVMCKSIRIIEKGYTFVCCFYSPFDRFLFSPNFLPLRASNLWCYFKNWNHFIDPFLLLSLLNHLSTSFINLLYLILMDLFSSCIQISHLFIKLM